jgi:hypothetical protein
MSGGKGYTLKGRICLEFRQWQHISSQCLQSYQKNIKTIFICFSVFIFKLCNGMAIVKQKIKSPNKSIQREQWCYEAVSYIRKTDRSSWRKGGWKNSIIDPQLSLLFAKCWHVLLKQKESVETVWTLCAIVCLAENILTGTCWTSMLLWTEGKVIKGLPSGQIWQ